MRRPLQSGLVLAGGVLLGAILAAVAAQDAGRRAFALPGRMTLELPGGWVERRDMAPPPPALLAPSAPKVDFFTAAVFEHRRAPAALVLAVSDNPFEGLGPATLDAQLRGAGTGRRLAEYLFFFFFPPPERCLADAATAFERQRVREEASRILASEEDKSLAPPRPVRATVACRFGQTARDFFAERISPGVTLRGTGHPSSASGSLEEFYLPPVEQVEFAGHTFFLFEAQSQRDLDLPELDRYELDHALRGGRAHFFWAVGARTPFPFARDPLRPSPPLLHVVYATVSASGDARPEFRRLLESIEFTP